MTNMNLSEENKKFATSLIGKKFKQFRCRCRCSNSNVIYRQDLPKDLVIKIFGDNKVNSDWKPLRLTIWLDTDNIIKNAIFG